MRHIDLPAVLAAIMATDEGARVKAVLRRAHLRVAGKQADQRQDYIKRNGTRKWSLLKELLLDELGKKCWYTEVSSIAGPLTMDHFRPKAHYWWLAFDMENYRVACWYSNSNKVDKDADHTGGKGDEFPLLPPGIRAMGRNRLRIESPVLLDPCVVSDCELVAFGATGRLVVNPAHSADTTAVDRVAQSEVLLNLNLADFNAVRERLYHDIEEWVEEHEEPGATDKTKRRRKEKLRRALLPIAQFSSAARCYVSKYRYLDWVQELLDEG